MARTMDIDKVAEHCAELMLQMSWACAACAGSGVADEYLLLCRACGAEHTPEELLASSIETGDTKLPCGDPWIFLHKEREACQECEGDGTVSCQVPLRDLMELIRREVQ